MSVLTKRSSNNLIARLFLILLICVIGFIVLDLIINDNALYLLIFVFFYTILPGLLFMKLAVPDLCCDKGWMLLISFYFGFFLLVVQYYTLNLAGVLHFIRFTPLVILLIEYILLRCKKSGLSAGNFLPGRSLSSINPDKITPFLFLLTMYLLYSYTMMKKTVPDENATVFVDYLYHMGNITTLVRGGRLIDLRLNGITFRYHYFMELFYAILRLVFPVTNYQCIFRFSILIASVLACGSFYKLIYYLSRNRTVSALTAVLTLFYSDLEPYYTHLTSHTGTNINAVGIALPCAVVLIYLFIYLIEHADKKITPAFFLILFGTGICLTGLKGPFAIIIVGGSVLCSLFFLLKRYPGAGKVFCGMLVMILSFGIIWFLLLRTGINEENLEEGAWFHGLLRFSMAVPKPFTDIVNGSGIAAVLLIPYHLIYSFGFLAVPFAGSAAAMVRSLIRRENVQYSCLFLIVVSLLSLGSYYMLAVDQNRLYFLMLAAPCMAAVAVSYTLQILRSHRNWGIFLVLSGAVLVCISAFNSIRYPVIYPGSGILSADDIDTAEWIRENTEQDAVFAINEHTENGKYFYYTGCSERQFYIETAVYGKNSGNQSSDLEETLQKNDMIYASDNAERRQLAQDLGIDYIIYLDYSGAFETDLSNDFGLEYANDTVRIYSIKESG